MKNCPNVKDLSKYCKAIHYNQPVARREHRLSSGFEEQIPYIKMRLNERFDIILKELFAELQEGGHRGSYSTHSENMKRFGVRMRPSNDTIAHLPTNDIFWRPSKTSVLFFKRRNGLSGDEKHLLSELCIKSKPIKETYDQISEFRCLSPKNVGPVGKISGLAIQALKAPGKDEVLDMEIKHIQELLKKKKPTRLEHHIRLAPAWIRELMLPVLK